MRKIFSDLGGKIKLSLENISAKISEFDVQTGLECCGGEEEFFIEMLGDYTNGGKDQSLAKFFEEEDWGNYEIDVHSLKSTSRMMGLPELGDMCEGLQTAAASKDADYIKANHPIMMERFLKYIEVIREEL